MLNSAELNFYISSTLILSYLITTYKRIDWVGKKYLCVSKLLLEMAGGDMHRLFLHSHGSSSHNLPTSSLTLEVAFLVNTLLQTFRNVKLPSSNI